MPGTLISLRFLLTILKVMLKQSVSGTNSKGRENFEYAKKTDGVRTNSGQERENQPSKSNSKNNFGLKGTRKFQLTLQKTIENFRALHVMYSFDIIHSMHCEYICA